MARSVLVTGASRGIGAAVALAFLSDGDNVVLVGRDVTTLKESVTGKDIASGKPYFVAADLSTPEGCEQCMKEAILLLGGKLDVLINNAGAGKLGCSMKTTTLETWDFHINVNLRSVFLMTQLATPYLEASKGSIVNISSIAALRPFVPLMPYCVAKAGVDMLTKCAALEMGPSGVRVNAINPATVKTGFHEMSGMSKEAASGFYEDAVGLHPIGRVGTPEDIAQLALFLSDSAKSGFLTGQIIVVDGGRLLPVPTGGAMK